MLGKKMPTKKTPSSAIRRTDKKMTPLVLAYDLGGTKVAVAIVNSRGKILREIREPASFLDGKNAVLRQLETLGKTLMAEYPGRVTRVGIASAGPLDPSRGLLLDPTNFKDKSGKTWGTVPLAQILAKKLGLPVYLENDAAAAILAETWIGAAKGLKNAMILTLGTGLGTGIIANGQLVRAGRGLHPEAGHIPLLFNDRKAQCGCGNLGCAEVFLSGKNFGKRAAARLKNPRLDARAIAELARRKEPEALALFREYATHLAAALRAYVFLYAPEMIVLTGSFAAASDLFLKDAQKQLEWDLRRYREGVDLMPRLKVSALNNEAGVLGAAWVAHFRA